MKKVFINSFVLFYVFLLVNVNAASFSDSVFNNNDWSFSVISVTGSNSYSASSYQNTTGGNPDEYRYLTHTYGGSNGPSSIITGHRFDQSNAVYNPQIQGAIQDITFNFDLLLIDGGQSNAVAYGGLIYQNGSYYTGGYELTTIYPKLNVWTNHSITLEASNFSLRAGSGPATPDFSSNGDEIQFGYYAANGTSIYSQTSTHSGIDNWSASVQPQNVPEPGTMLLLGSVLLGMFGIKFRNNP